MLLRTKAIVTLCLLFSLFIALTYLIHQRIMIPHFLQLERQELETCMHRLHHGIRNELEALTRMAIDYGSWDDTYAFAKDGNEAFIESNLIPSTFTGNEINLISIVSTDGRILWGGAMDLAQESFIELAPFGSQELPADHVLHPSQNSAGLAGLLSTEHGPMLVASEPVLTGESQGPTRGSFITGKLLTETVMAKIRSAFSLNVSMAPFEASLISEDLRSRLQEQQPRGTPFETSSAHIALSSILKDLEGTPILIATVSIPRTMLAQGRREARLAILSVIGGGLLVLLVVLWLLNRFIFAPLQVLRSQVARVRDAGNPAIRIQIEGSDEFSELSESLNEMLTELQRVQENVQKSEARLELALSGAQLGLWDWNPSTGHCVFNRRWTEMLGYDLDEIRPHIDAWRELIHPEDRDRADQRLDAHLSGESSIYESSYRLRHKSGSWRWMLTRGKIVLRDAGGKPQRLSGTHLDITDFRQAEDRYRMLFEQMYSGFAHLEMLLDADGQAQDARFLAANPAFEKHTGLDVSDIVGKTLRQVLPEIEHSWIKTISDVAATGKPSHTQDHWQALDRYLNISVFSPADNQIGLVVQDITEQSLAKQTQQDLEEKFRQAQKLESLGVLAGGIAHDFNNLLMGILGNTELARDDVPTGSSADVSLREIELAAKRAADLCRQMLAYSGKGKLAIEPLDLNELITEISELLMSSISKKSQLSFNLLENLPTVEADASQVRQIVMNLIINASEAMGEVPGQVTLRTKVRECDTDFLDQSYIEQELSPGSYVCLEVEDSGFGMDKATRQRIFDPFFTTKFTGRGLGLAAVMGIVRGHGGAIMVESEPRKGSLFTVLLPVSGKPVPVRMHQERAILKLSGQTTILLVDDEGAVRVAASRMLESLGFTVVLARNGNEAVVQFKALAGEINCVILDLTMPQLDGGETLRLLRAIDPEVPIILSSGFDKEQAQEQIAGLKISGFLHKPYQLEALGSVLRTALNTG